MKETMNRKIKRIYHPHTELEEINYNMWGSVGSRSSYLNVAIDFTSDSKLYGFYMKRVSQEWPISCEHNLTNDTQNRKAWIGHAACALAFQCPEDIVREAWKHLTEKQQAEANKVADIAIQLWEKRYLEGLCRKEN